MCHLCKTKPVYEFTNQRKLCKRCFANYFEKKILYIIRKFDMIKREDIVGYKKDDSLRGVVLENTLKFISERADFTVIKLPNKKWEPPAGSSQLQHPNRKLKANKIADDSCLDSESENIIKTLIDGNASDLKRYLPVYGNIIKPLYLFLEQEILLYTQIKNLKFSRKEEKKGKISSFIDNFEKKHPEVKRAIVNSLLELYK